MKLNKEQSNLLANGFKDLANLSIAALIFGNILGNTIKLLPIIIGIILYLVFNIWAIYLLKEEG